MVGLGRQEAPRGFQDGPRGPQEAAKTAQDGPRRPQDGPRWLLKWSQDRRKSLLKYSIVIAGPLKSSKVPLELVFGRILIEF